MNTLGKAGLVAASLFASNVQSADLINSGFEAPTVVNASQFQTIFPGFEPSGFGWSVNSGTVDAVIRGSNFGQNAFEGLQWLDLDGVSVGSISQTFATVIGTDYALHFAYANHPLPGFTASFPARARVQVIDSNGTTPLISPRDISHWNSTIADLGWNVSSDIVFRAISTSTKLTFLSTDLPNSQGGIFLDAVTVTAVPELPPFATLTIGLVALSVLTRRSRP